MLTPNTWIPDSLMFFIHQLLKHTNDFQCKIYQVLNLYLYSSEFISGLWKYIQVIQKHIQLACWTGFMFCSLEICPYFPCDFTGGEDITVTVLDGWYKSERI